MPPEIRTRATLRSAEFGFFGVVVYTRVQTPRRCGAATFFLRPLPDLRPGVASFLDFGWRPLRISCEVVGMRRGSLAARSAPATHDLDRNAGDLGGHEAVARAAREAGAGGEGAVAVDGPREQRPPGAAAHAALDRDRRRARG